MKLPTFFGLAAAVTLAALLPGERDARACAVFTPDQTAPVVGHQMILSVGKDQTTLWDQFSYAGPPESFGWILPIKGMVEVGLSADALFTTLGEITAPTFTAPPLGCPNSCKGGDGPDSGGGFGNGGVTVVAEEVVGPFSTAQLSAQDPDALKTWLTQNGYPIPQGIGPILDAYVAEGFSFLALKLLPDKGLDAVQPIRVTFPGAMPSVPLRLLAAGTGELTQVTLWVVGEGRWEPSNAPVVKIADSELSWDFTAEKSDYEKVRADKLAATDGKGWLIESARSYDPSAIKEPLENFVQSDPTASGYGGDGKTPEAALAEDLDALTGGLAGGAWVTRLTADLSRKAFAQDLTLGASADQSEVDGTYQITNAINKPVCPPDPCGGIGGSGGTGNPTGGSADGESSSCNLRAGGGEGGAHIALIGLGALLALARRRRRSAPGPTNEAFDVPAPAPVSAPRVDEYP